MAVVLWRKRIPTEVKSRAAPDLFRPKTSLFCFSSCGKPRADEPPCTHGQEDRFYSLSPNVMRVGFHHSHCTTLHWTYLFNSLVCTTYYYYHQLIQNGVIGRNALGCSHLWYRPRSVAACTVGWVSVWMYPVYCVTNCLPGPSPGQVRRFFTLTKIHTMEALRLLSVSRKLKNGPIK